MGIRVTSGPDNTQATLPVLDRMQRTSGWVGRPRRMLDLFCGRFGWGRAFAARGWEVVGIDLVEPAEIPAGCDFIQQDILKITKDSPFMHWDDGGRYFNFVCASSPCEQFSVHRMKNFHPNPPYPEMGIRLFNHTRALCESYGVPYIQENVRTAENFVGRAVNHAGSFYLWGNAVPPLLPKNLTKGMKMDRAWCQKLGGHGTKQRDSQTAGFATIPSELANCVADFAERTSEAGECA